MNKIITVTKSKTTEQVAEAINIYAGNIIKVVTDTTESTSNARITYYEEGAAVKEIIVDETISAISDTFTSLILIKITSSDTTIGDFLTNASRIVRVDDNVKLEDGTIVRRILLRGEGADNEEFLVTDTVLDIKGKVIATANSNTTGLNVLNLEIEVNEVKKVLRDSGLMAI